MTAGSKTSSDLTALTGVGAIAENSLVLIYWRDAFLPSYEPFTVTARNKSE